MRPRSSLRLLALVVLASCLNSALATAGPAEPALGNSITVGTPDGVWLRSAPPLARDGQSATLDPVRNRMLMFGGGSGINGFNDVWALLLNGNPVWQDLTPGGSGTGFRRDHSAIFDPVRDRMVVYGGRLSTAFGDVYALELSGTKKWVHLLPTGTPPSARYGHTAFYDAAGDRMIVFGGNTGSVRLNDVWALSLAGTPAWTQLTPSGTPPPVRWGHTGAYDPAGNRLIVFGGNNVSTAYNDVWQLSLDPSPAWTQLTPTGGPPGGRWVHTAVLDTTRHRMVISGGYNGTTTLSDVWALSLGATPAWTALAPTGTPQGPRWGHSAVYDPGNDRMVMFAGNAGVADSNNVMSVRFAKTGSWVPIFASLNPPVARSQHSAVYDALRARMLVFGGIAASIRFNDVSALPLDGIHPWEVLVPLGTPPAPRVGQSVIYDPLRDALVVFGGNTSTGNKNDVWSLTLQGTPIWAPILPTGTPPTPRLNHRAIYDPVRDRMLVFGGTTATGSANDVWALSLVTGSNAWTQLTPAGTPPGPRTESAAIYDPVRDQMVISAGRLDGSTWYNDMWTLSLSGTPTWNPFGTAISPMSGHSALYDALRDRMVLFGGFDGGSVSNTVVDMPLATPELWTELSPTGPLQPSRSNHSAVYDPLRDQMVVFGGTGNGGTLVPNEVMNLRWGGTLGVDPGPGGEPLSLSPAYPNPSQGGISIDFALSRPGEVALRVYDVSGRIVNTLVDGPLAAGPHSLRWDGRTRDGARVGPGLYFYQLRADGQKVTKRISFVR